MLKNIVFDFDGTLVDSRAVFILVYNQIAEANGFKLIEANNLEYLRSLSMLERFKALEVPLYKLPFLTNKFLAGYNNNIELITLVPGMEEVLQELHTLPIGVSIVSSNSTPIIESFLALKNITSVSDILCSSKIFGKAKVLRQFLKNNNLRPDEVIYICDELRDVEACQKINIKSVWVAWGYETPDPIYSKTTAEIVHSPAQLLTLLKAKLAVSDKVIAV